MKSDVALIAEALLANIRCIEALIAKLPAADQAAVAETVKAANPTPAPTQVTTPAPAPTPIQAAAPAPAIPTPPVAAPIVGESAPTVAPAPAVANVTAPFNDKKGLTNFVMARYRELGPIKGAEIQRCLDECGVHNVNDLAESRYGEFYQKVMALV
jgi:hypothetical protein